MSQEQQNTHILVRLILLFILLIISAACTGKKQLAKNATATPVFTEGSSSNIETSGPVVITFAVPEPLQNAYAPLIEKFQKQSPNITVQLVSPPGGFSAWFEEDLNPLASAADTTLLFDRNRMLGNSSYFRDLTPLIDSDTSFQSDDFWPGMLAACQDSDSRMLGIPLSVSFYGIYFNPVVFDAAGVTHPKPGWTWDDFQHAVTALTIRNVDKTQYGFADSMMFTSSILAPQIDSYLTSTNGKIEASVLASKVQWYLDLAQAGSLYPIASTTNNQQTSDQLEKIYQNEPPAMWVGGLDMADPQNQDQLAIRTYGLAPFPIGGSSKNTTPLVPTCGVISAGSTHTREAWAWLNFLSHQWPLDRPSSNSPGTAIPARPSVSDVIHFWDNIPTQAVPAIHFGLEHGWSGSLYPAMFTSIEQALFKTLNGQTDLITALGEASATGTTIPVETQITVATLEPTQALSGDTIVIKYLAPTMPSGDTTYKTLAEEFHRLHPDLAVEVNESFSFPPGTDTDYLSVLSENFDCFTYSPVFESENTNVLSSLNTFLDSENVSLRQDFYPGQLEEFTINGEIYALPASFRPMVMYYNNDLLAKKGLQPPENNWTTEDFVRLISAVTSTKEQIYGIIGADWIIAEAFSPYWEEWQNDPTLAKLDSPESISVAERLAELNKAGVLAPVGGQNVSESFDQMISSGRIAFWMGLAEDSNFMGFNVNFKIGFVPLPSIPGHQWPAMNSNDIGQYISRNSKKPQACWTWMKFLSEQPNAFPGVPPRRSVAESPAWEASVGHEKAALYRVVIQQTSPFGFNPIVATLVNQFQIEAWNAIYTGADPTQAMTEEQRKVDIYINCLKDSNALNNQGKELQEKSWACYQKTVP